MSLSIEAKKRPEGSKPNALRRDGILPANLYGHDGSNSILLTVETHTFERLLKYTHVGNTTIELNIPELSWKGNVVVQEVQTHPWKKYPYHVSFMAIVN
jgi:large subunit ribosomal protein L25